MSDPRGPEGGGVEHERLGAYVLAIVSWWREMVLVAVAASVLGAVGPLALQLVVPKYTASADVAIIPSRANVSFDDRFKAVEVAPARFRYSEQGKRAALVGLVHKPDIAPQVFNQLRMHFDDDASPASLLANVDAELVTIGLAGNLPQSDLIRITAQAHSATAAKAMADAWAETFVADINVLYEEVPSWVVETVQAERASVRDRYREAERKLQEFTSTSDIDLLAQQIATKQTLIDEVASTWRLTATASFQRDMQSRLATLDKALERLRTLESSLVDAKGLQGQLRTDGTAFAASSTLAVYLFKARLIGGEVTLDIDLAGLPQVTVADLRQDLDATIDSLTEQIAELKSAVAVQTSELGSVVSSGNGTGTVAGTIRSQLEDMTKYLDVSGDQPMIALLSQLESEKRELAVLHQDSVAQQADLTLERDLMRETLTTLQNEVVELELALASAPSQVRLASLAVLPVDSAWPAPALVAGILFVLGGLAALFMAPLAGALGREPPVALWFEARRHRHQTR